MDIEILTLCDFAQANDDKMSLLGAFNKLVFNSFPSTYTFSIATRVRFEPETSGDKQFTFNLVDEDNKSLFTPLMAVVNLKDGNKDFISVNLIINIQNNKFEKPGNYRLVVETTDGNFERPLKVMTEGLDE